MGPKCGPPGADRTQVGPRWALCGPHEPCYLGSHNDCGLAQDCNDYKMTARLQLLQSCTNLPIWYLFLPWWRCDMYTRISGIISPVDSLYKGFDCHLGPLSQNFMIGFGIYSWVSAIFTCFFHDDAVIRTPKSAESFHRWIPCTRDLIVT